MTAPVIPRLRVDAPPQPPAARFGLFSAATVLDNVPAHALGGVEYEGVCSTRVDLYPAPCRDRDATPTRKQPQPTTSVTDGTPFVVYAADECVLGRDQTEALTQLRQRFEGGEQTTVERGILGGTEGNLPNLTGTVPDDSERADYLDVLTATGGEPDLEDAVGLLEQWLADTTGGVGVIHAPRWLAARAFSKEIATVSGQRALTPLGNTWAFGTGYDGRPPAGETSTDLWLYATSTITVRRSDLVQPATWSTGAFSRDENTGFLLYERVYVIEWPCNAAALRVNLPRLGYTVAEPTPP